MLSPSRLADDADCEDGLRPGNVDPALAYAGGYPDERDPELPVRACWKIIDQPGCARSNGAEVIVARRDDPPPRSFTIVSCVLINKIEQLCNDAVDNDQDCLVDSDDPDCS